MQEYYLVALAQQRPEEDPSQVMKAAVSAAMGKLVTLTSLPGEGHLNQSFLCSTGTTSQFGAPHSSTVKGHKGRASFEVDS